MAEQNYTIPVNEIFEARGGCPLCRMQAMLEERSLDYITGAAMMEPDVRIQTNAQGFCHRHFAAMQSRAKALPVALVMESHLKYIKSQLVGESPLAYKPPKRPGEKSAIGEMLDDCYVCRKIRWALDEMLDTICRLWKRDNGFRELYTGQDHLCLRHYNAVMAAAPAVLRKQDLLSFQAASHALTKRYLDTLLADVSHFCTMFDYRNAQGGADWGNSKDSVKRAAEYLRED